MEKDFKKLENLIKTHTKGQNVYYAANSGNWGDSLIREGTTKFLRDIGLDYQELRLVQRDWVHPVLKGGVVLYGGGGAWCRSWTSSEKYVKVISKRFKVIVLPSTFELSFKIPNTIFTRRDEYESKKSMPGTLFCHDMAFYLGEQPFKEGSGVGYFYRTDKESKGMMKKTQLNRDISAEGNHFSEGITFFKEVAKYSEIHTDRLHVAITACLLGKELHLYPGSYFKNLAVFKSSIEPYFKNVTFHDV